MDRTHGKQVFGDMVNTLTDKAHGNLQQEESWHELERGVYHDWAQGVC